MPPLIKLPPQFSPRQRAILHLAADGFTNHQIAAELSIGYWTVREHIDSIFKKLKINDRTRMALWAVANREAIDQ